MNKNMTLQEVYNLCLFTKCQNCPFIHIYRTKRNVWKNNRIETEYSKPQFKCSFNKHPKNWTIQIDK